MITVRFPTGFSVQYNDAHYAERRSDFTDLYGDSTKKIWYAQVPTQGCIVEVRQPCRTYSATENPVNVTEAFARLLDDPEQRDRASVYTLKRIKARLGEFNATRQRWK